MVPSPLPMVFGEARADWLHSQRLLLSILVCLIQQGGTHTAGYNFDRKTLDPLGTPQCHNERQLCTTLEQRDVKAFLEGKLFTMCMLLSKTKYPI